MGQPAARLGDIGVCSSRLGAVPAGAQIGGPFSGLTCPHVLIGGVPAAQVGETRADLKRPDTIVEGSPSVLFGGRPAARMGDSTAQGGVIVSGFPSVLIS
ncbi:MAG: type VI secretion protein [Rhodopirellula sp.]|nr:type VI secretion protein [Rhodopirellula sp.]